MYMDDTEAVGCECFDCTYSPELQRSFQHMLLATYSGGLAIGVSVTREGLSIIGTVTSQR